MLEAQILASPHPSESFFSEHVLTQTLKNVSHHPHDHSITQSSPGMGEQGGGSGGATSGLQALASIANSHQLDGSLFFRPESLDGLTMRSSDSDPTRPYQFPMMNSHVSGCAANPLDSSRSHV